MAFHHAAYTFRIDEFHSSLMKKVVSDKHLDINLLRSLAIEVAKNADAKTQKVLDHFRFDEAWLSNPDGESHDHLWYMVVLAGEVEIGLGLDSWFLLGKCLPVLGWDETMKNQLIGGKPIRTYLEKFKGGIFQRISGGTFGGYLTLNDIENMKIRLSQLSESFEYPSDTLVNEVNEMARLVQTSIASPQKILKSAYDDAQDMLNAAIREEKDLLLHLD